MLDGMSLISVFNESPWRRVINVMSYLCSYRKVDVVKILSVKIVCDSTSVEVPHE